SLLGAPGTGKTCFLAGLNILGQPSHESHIDVVVLEGTASLHESTARLHEKTWPMPSICQFERFRIRVELARRVLLLTIPDYPGGDFLAAMQKDISDVDLTEEVNADLVGHFRQASVLILMIDPTLDLEDPTVKPQVKSERVRRQSALLRAVQHRALPELAKRSKAWRRTERPLVAIVLTKADQAEELNTSTTAQD